MRFRERHQDPNSTDLEYAARINHLDGVDAFIKAHSSAPSFTAGLLHRGTSTPTLRASALRST